MKIGSQYYWYHNDHLGTPQKLTTTSGAVVWSAKYSSFGKATIDPSSTVANPLRFPGQYEDPETGLHYNWFRYYQPDIGRYIRTDPIGFYGGQANLYGYVSNKPIMYIDPWGLGKIGAIIGGAIGAGVGVVAGTLETVGTFGGGIVIAPAIVAGSAAIGAGIGHYAEEGIKGIIDFLNSPDVPIYMDEVFTTDEGIVIVIPAEDPNTRDWCKEQIQDAQDFCIDQYSKPNSAIPKGVCGDPNDGPGGWSAIQRCVERNIPEICGGDPVS